MQSSWYFPIRWKLSLALTGLSFVLVGIYVLIAKEAFESDKIAYVFETEQSRIDTVAKSFDQRIETALFLGTSILSTYDVSSKKFSQVSTDLFAHQPTLLSVELWRKGESVPNAKLSKSDFRNTAFNAKDCPAPGKIQVLPAGSNRLQLISGQKSSVESCVRVTLEVLNLFPQGSGISFILASTNDSLMSYSSTLSPPELKTVALEMTNQRNKTSLRKIGSEDYLISSATSEFGDLVFFALTPKSSALGGLAVLFRRSVFFFFFSGFLTVTISLLLSRGLTKTLGRLTETALRIGKGEFSHSANIQSHDEIGVLSSAFQKMGGEIERLLIETKDKARMEAELKTASLVQESLFPKKPDYGKNQITLSGFSAASTECGGDWWHYFEKGDELYIAIGDATGHGTPAALITAAARSAFSQIERMEDASLNEMMSAWSDSILSCSANKIFMTAILMRIDTKTGSIDLVNASHEWPFHYVANSDGQLTDAEFMGKAGSTLGEEGRHSWVEQTLRLDAGDRLLVYTDGLFSVVNAENKSLPERTLRRLMTKDVRPENTVEQIAGKVRTMIDDYRQGQTFPDDVTVIAISRAA